MNKIEIKDVGDNVIYTHEQEDNNVKITLEKAVKEGVKLFFADLVGVDLSYANLSGASLARAALVDAKLAGADLSRAYLSWTDLSGAVLLKANLSGAKLEGAIYNNATTFPEGFNPEDHDMIKEESQEMSYKTKQIGGDHYSGFAIPPIDFVVKNKLGFLEGNAIKYIVRHGKKNGKEDLLKAVHYIEMMIEEYYPDE